MSHDVFSKNFVGPFPYFVVTSEEETIIVRKVNAFLAAYPIEAIRQILWKLLRNSITEDVDGIKWLYAQLKEFIEDEFSE